MKAYGISRKFYKAKKIDNIHGGMKKKGFMNWWEEIAIGVNKSLQRKLNKIKI